MTKNHRIAFIAGLALAGLIALPIVASAQTGTMFVNNNKVGIGIATPENQLHVVKTTSGASVMGHFENNGIPIVEYEDTNLGIRWFLNPDGLGNWVITKDGTGGAELTVGSDGSFKVGPGALTRFTVLANGNATLTGTLTQGSSRSIKQGFADLDPQEVLARVADLEVLEWSYLNQGTRHIGPMAEDFRGLFGTGDSEKSLAPSDVAGVTMVALQGLHEVVQEKDRQIEQLSRDVAELRAIVEALASK